MLEWMERPHRRLNPLTGEWVLVSPQRTERPWQGEMEKQAPQKAPPYDPKCYLCPGNERSGGVRNPDYKSTFVFDNDFPALLPEGAGSLNDRELFVANAERGVCRVVCFSPRHDLSIPSIDPEALTTVVETWRQQLIELRNLPFIRYVQIFENRGLMMGTSNPHPHCQIWATEHIPNEIHKEEKNQGEYWDKHNNCLLCDYVGLERAGERLVCENESFLAVVPFWAIWPFETLLMSKRHVSDLEGLQAGERHHLAAILREVTQRYDRLFDTAFPYSMGFHQLPKGGAPDVWHLHAHFYPPLLRSATIRKFMVGFEMLAGAQRDITPEMAASRLRGAG